jgi:hypothetical protein
MRRFYFIHETTEPYSRVSIESESLGLDEVLRDMECFLRGVGYHFDGKLEIVNWDDPQVLPVPLDALYSEIESEKNENPL